MWNLISFISLSIAFFAPISAQICPLQLPLSTSGRWIVDQNGDRVKLACVNLPSHLEPSFTEGLNHQPIEAIAKRVVSLGFNCVRLTWPLFLFTNDTLGSSTVRESFQSLALTDAISGILENNPSLIDLSLVDAYQTVVARLGEANVMVILDNHISRPGWCCNNQDDNGFFGDKYFDPDEWITGLTRVASSFYGSPWVVGMSLRNELRGSRQNVNDWYRFMQSGAEAVHSANPNVLVILSGLAFDKDLSFLHSRPVNLSFAAKAVFEMHWYSFTDGNAWTTGNPNEVCGKVLNNVMRMSGFLLGQDWPLMVTEFGVDQRGMNMNDNRYLGCILGLMAEMDLDWALWTLSGSYYLRNGIVGLDETYGILTWDWGETRNASFLQQISTLQGPFQGPGLHETSLHKLIFHPLTGLCVVRKSLFEPLTLGPCKESDAWKYGSRKTLTIAGTYFCIQAVRLNEPVRLGLSCAGSNSKWEISSSSRMHLSTQLNGTVVCLDVDGNRNVIVSGCKCINSDNTCEPGSQWFKIFNSTRAPSKMGSFPSFNTAILKTILGLDSMEEFLGL